jgi:hypothetical protein
MMNKRLLSITLLLATFAAAGCAAPQPARNDGPPRAGYNPNQVQQQQPDPDELRRRKAAGELLPGLIDLQNQMIENQNRR